MVQTSCLLSNNILMHTCHPFTYSIRVTPFPLDGAQPGPHTSRRGFLVFLGMSPMTFTSSPFQVWTPMCKESSRGLVRVARGGEGSQGPGSDFGQRAERSSPLPSPLSEPPELRGEGAPSGEAHEGGVLSPGLPGAPRHQLSGWTHSQATAHVNSFTGSRSVEVT